MIEDWMTVGSIKLTGVDFTPMPEEDTLAIQETIKAMRDLTFATQVVTIKMQDTSMALLRIMFGPDFTYQSFPPPMRPGMVVWDGRRRRKRRKR